MLNNIYLHICVLITAGTITVLTECLDVNSFMSACIKIRMAQSYDNALEEYAKNLRNRGSHAQVTSVLMDEASTEEQAGQLVGFTHVLSSCER